MNQDRNQIEHPGKKVKAKEKRTGLLDEIFLSFIPQSNLTTKSRHKKEQKVTIAISQGTITNSNYFEDRKKANTLLPLINLKSFKKKRRKFLFEKLTTCSRKTKKATKRFVRQSV